MFFPFHCWQIERVNASAVPCRARALVVWRDGEGVRHGYCERHLQVGHVEAVKHHWTLDSKAHEAAA